MSAEYLHANQADILEVIANLSNDAVFTPPRVVNAVLDLLPDELWHDPTLRWLDPASKTGVFPREITKRLTVDLADSIPDKDERLTHILTKMLFAFATEEITGLLSRRSLYCSKDASSEFSVVAFEHTEGNVWHKRVEHSFDAAGRCSECKGSKEQLEIAGRDNKAYGFIHEAGLRQIRQEMDMNFDVIVGNPPYQMDSDGNNRTLPLYNLFVDQAKALNAKYIAMIVPSRWMAGGLGLSSFRDAMLTDRRIRHLVDYPNASDVFPGVDIKGGICYFMWDRDHEGSCNFTMTRGAVSVGPEERYLDDYDVLIRDSRAIPILRKVLDAHPVSLERLVSPKRPFGLRTNFEGHQKIATSSAVRLYKSGKPAWVERSEISAHEEWIDRWKVITPKAGPGNSGGHVLPDMVLGKPRVSEPGSCCTETFIVIGPLDSEFSAQSLVSYAHTRFFRFLVSLRKVSQDAPRATYRWVPEQTWDRLWTDDDLYHKYGFTNDEQVYISEMVRDMPA